MASKWLNLILLGGLVCSGTVGTMYGYSYVKDNVKEYLVATKMDSKVAGELVSDAYSVGFMGQYAAFVPGMIFDAYGPVVTILTGAGMIGFGYNALAVGMLKGSQALIFLGIGLAGMGSKSLGMGSMLGSLSLVDESKVSTLSGVYLGLDACSAIFAVLAFILFFQKDVSADMTEDNISIMYKLDSEYVKKSAKQDQKFEVLGDFFGSIGIIIAIIGCCAAAVYHVGLKKIAQAKEEEKQAKSEEEEALLASGEDTKVAIKSQGSKPAKKEKKQVEKKTLWSGVVCVYLICMCGESMGLFFNKLTGEHAAASLDYAHVLSIKTVVDDRQHTVIKPHGENHEFVVTRQFLKIMGMGIPKKISLIELSKEDESYKVAVTADNKAKVEKTFSEKQAEEKAIYFTKDHEHGKTVYKQDRDAFKAIWGAKWNVFFLFTLGNAVGRLSFGITSDILAGYKILALTKSFYIMLCCALYIIFFGIFAMIPNIADAPILVNVLVAAIGITYGGIFTMVTAYMKEVCAKNQVGMLLGFALVILAVTTYCGNKFFYGKYIINPYDSDIDMHKMDDDKSVIPTKIGQNTLKSFCQMAMVGNIIALGVSIALWLQHMQIKKAELAAAEEADFTDESDDENEAEHEARK